MPSPEDVLSDLKANKYAPVYFLHGDEPYFIDIVSDYIEKNALDEASKGFNQMVMYGKDVKVQDILANARRYPMMSDRQVVIVKEAKDVEDIEKETGQKMLLDYFKNPLPSTILVFCHKYKSVDKRKSLGKALGNLTVLVDSKKLYDNQLPDFIKNHIKSRGFSINEKATRMLVENIGNDLVRLANEIDKMLVNFKEKKEINENDIQQHIGISKDYNAFELQKAITFRDVVKANQIVNYFEANPKNNPIIPLIALLFSFYCKLLRIHALPDKGEASISKSLGMNFYIAKEYAAAVKNYNQNKVIQIIGYIREADLRSKGVDASMTEGAILRELVFKLLH
ncbi:MAG: DNA polymerase III subunit delta [Cyclobacteriaceae bacterium]